MAAAVTTPVVFLSAAPAFADTKPSPAQTQKPAQGQDAHEDDRPPTLDELRAAVALAQKEYDEAVVAVDKAKADIDALDKADHPLKAAVTKAQKTADEAAAAKTAADTALAAAEKAVKDLPVDAGDEQKKAAADAVEAAKKTADEAAAAKTAADEALRVASKALADASVAAWQVLHLAQEAQKTASQKLDDAKEELAFFEDIEGVCEPDEAVRIDLSGPKKVTAGEPAVFSMRVTNTTDRTLDLVDVYADALRSPGPGEEIDEHTDFDKWTIPVEWSSADVLEWTPVDEKLESIEVGKLAKGAHYDVKLRLTAAADAPAGEGMLFGYGQYENNDGTCGMSLDDGYADFDILAAKGDKPKPKPTPSPSTTTPAPVPTTGNTGTTQQGGSSNTPVTDGNLAATGSNDALPMIGLAAAGAVALGAGAVFVARRRKAGSQA
ncbi:LAETG motif-containing sortase-dependent surface protein [Streptomyces sp. NPDC056488]|uniref:LAETG motif-containing sortase-dependent surface protein n=1 Tax=unclassified Streptomyces TaxID=2593676 RepID=UPI0036A3AC9F